jgi:hypothetical protein
MGSHFGREVVETTLASANRPEHAPAWFRDNLFYVKFNLSTADPEARQTGPGRIAARPSYLCLPQPRGRPALYRQILQGDTPHPRPPQPSRVPQTSQPPIAAGLTTNMARKRSDVFALERLDNRCTAHELSMAEQKWIGRFAATERAHGYYIARLRPNSAPRQPREPGGGTGSSRRAKARGDASAAAGQPENPARDAGRLAKLVVGAPRPRPLRLQCRQGGSSGSATRPQKPESSRRSAPWPCGKPASRCHRRRSSDSAISREAGKGRAPRPAGLERDRSHRERRII